jgi:hypothetical protein
MVTVFRESLWDIPSASSRLARKNLPLIGQVTRKVAAVKQALH